MFALANAPTTTTTTTTRVSCAPRVRGSARITRRASVSAKASTSSRDDMDSSALDAFGARTTRAFVAVIASLNTAAFVVAATPAPAVAKVATEYVAVLTPTKSGSGASGTVTFTTEINRSNQEVVVAKANIKGLSAGKHGFNIHENGDVASCDAEGACTGKSYNPDSRPHRGPTSVKKFGASACHGLYDGCVLNRHIGDLGNIVATDDGVSTTTVKDLYTTLKPGTSNYIGGRSVVIRAGADDFETEENDGNAGPIILYGEIVPK